MNCAPSGKSILIHGMCFILVGLLWGLAVPHTPYPRLALTAHIQFEESGLIFIALALPILTLPNSVGRKSICVMILSVWLTWLMAFSEVANSWWGTTDLLTIAAHQAGATGGTPLEEKIVLLAHITSGISLIAAWALLIIGFAKTPANPPAGASITNE
jgi:(hydroxyamino)benzene mutase